MNIKEDDVVLCTVKKIEGATIFVDIEDNGQGTIIMSEIAAGRIRNLRDYVSPNKKIVCKVLKIYPDHIELTLRRVTAKEKDLTLDKHKKERNLLSMLKTVTEDPKKTLRDIKLSYNISEFLDEARENPKIIQRFLNPKQAQALAKIFSEKKEKPKKVKKTITLKSDSPHGIDDIKEILDTKEANIQYLGSSNFSIEIQAKDFKTAEKTLSNVLEKIGKKAKQKHALLVIKDK